MKLVRDDSRLTLGKRLGVTWTLLLAVAASGCIGGTTYGTGVSQEEQTMKDITNMFTLRKDRKNIEYAPRPDLVVPENRQNLPEPLDSEVAEANPQWPESPEQRIARIRAAAEDGLTASGEMSLEERLRKKEGINIETRRVNGEFIPGRTDRDGVEIMFPGGNNEEVRKAVLERREQLGVSTGPNRKYLTEPPIEYRIPAETAPAGAQAYSEEEIAERERIAEEQAKSDPNLMPKEN
jgi:hypothetical protein